MHSVECYGLLSCRKPILSAAVRLRPIILVTDEADNSSFIADFPVAALDASSSALRRSALI
jgi:hypothetical protein